MSSHQFLCRVRERRAARGWSQARLAEHLQVSRQAIGAIEAGRQIPSTLLALQLAQSLDCRVEDLFATGGPRELLASMVDAEGSVRPRRCRLGLVDGAWVAHPVSDSHEPADAVSVGGPGANPGALLRVFDDQADLWANVLVAGCAPLLGLLSKRSGNSSRAVWLKAPSMKALQLLEQNQVHVAGVHLAASIAPGGHDQVVKERFPSTRMCVFHLTRWRQGWVVAPGNPLGIRGAGDIRERQLRLVRRDAGSAAQCLLEESWRKDTAEAVPQFPGPVATSHEEVARLVQMGVSDVGVAIEPVAMARGLTFIPLSEERFDLVVPQSRLEHPAVARFFDALSEPAFRFDAGGIPGYDLSSIGQVSTLCH